MNKQNIDLKIDIDFKSETQDLRTLFIIIFLLIMLCFFIKFNICIRKPYICNPLDPRTWGKKLLIN